MISHTEGIRRVVSVTRELGDEGFYVLCVAVVTTGGIHKTLRIPHYYADVLRALIAGEVSEMGEAERVKSWQASMPRKRATI